MTAPSEVVNASPPGPSRAMPVNWHLRCVLRIRMAGFPTCGEIVHGHVPVSRIQRSELLQDRGICTHDRISGSFSSSPAFIDHRMRAMPQEYADESGSRTLQI